MGVATTKRPSLIYHLLISLLGLAILLVHAPMLSRIAPWELIVLSSAFALINLLAIRLPSGLHMSAAYPLILAAIITHGPAVAVLMATAGFALRCAVYHESPLRALTSSGQIAIAALWAGGMHRALGGAPGAFIVPAGLLHYILVAITFDLINRALAQWRQVLDSGGNWLGAWTSSVLYERGWVLPIYSVLAIIIILLEHAYGPWGLAIGYAPVLSLHGFLRLQSQMPEVRRLAETDRLTGLANYRRLTGWLSSEFDPIVAAGRTLSVLWVDVDGLKAINDSVGHDAGNAVLKAVAAVLIANTRLGDLVARYGGDEFVVLLPDIRAGATDAVRHRILEAAETLPVLHRGHALSIALSIGAASYPADAGTPDQLMRAADAAMYAAKRRKREADVADADVPFAATVPG